MSALCATQPVSALRDGSRLAPAPRTWALASWHGADLAARPRAAGKCAACGGGAAVPSPQFLRRKCSQGHAGCPRPGTPHNLWSSLSGGRPGRLVGRNWQNPTQLGSAAARAAAPKPRPAGRRHLVALRRGDELVATARDNTHWVGMNAAQRR